MKQLVKILISLCAIGICTLSVDYAIRPVDRLLPLIPDGGTQYARNNYCILKCTAECVILGSSRANHHYQSNLLADSLKLSVYNTGADGQGIPYCHSVFFAVSARQLPKLVILELGYDALSGKESSGFTAFKPYYVLDTRIRTTLQQLYGPAEAYKCMSSMYRYNSALHYIAQSLLTESCDTLHGYVPLAPNQWKGELRTDDSQPAIDPYHEEMLLEIVNYANTHGIKLVVMISPEYIHHTRPSQLASFCEKYQVSFFDNTGLAQFISHPEFFNDAIHLNHQGAYVYTQHVIEQIQDILKR